MMPGRAVLILVFSLLVAFGASSAAPAVSKAASCPDPSSMTFAQLWRLFRADAPPGTGRGSGGWAAARRCFGSKPFTVRAYVGISAGIGGTSPTGVNPGYWEWPDLIVFGTSRSKYGFTWGPYLGIVVPPRLGNLQRAYRRSWVDLTVRFNHPLAQECVGRGPKKLGRPTRKEAIAFCRRQPVVVAIHRAVSLPATDALSPTDARAPAADGSRASGATPTSAPGGSATRELPVLLAAGLVAALVGLRRHRPPGRQAWLV